MNKSHERLVLSRMLNYSIAAGEDRDSRYFAGAIENYCSLALSRLREYCPQPQAMATQDGAAALFQLLGEIEMGLDSLKRFTLYDARRAFVISRRVDRGVQRGQVKGSG